MYITITPQKLGGSYSQSVADYVDYLEKENQGFEQQDMEHFFNQYSDEISAKEVVKEIDGNTAKLKKTEPKFYSITISPSKYELKQLQNSSSDLKAYTREVMKDYVASFNREINGKAVTIDDIKYYAKIEHQRKFKGTDFQVKENQPYASKILQLKQDIRKIENGKLESNISKLKKRINQLEKEAPHQQNVKRGFDRDSFFANAEKTFDKQFGYKRNYAETYQAKKDFIKNPKLYFSVLMGLPTNEKATAFKILGKSGVPMINIPTNKAQLAIKAFKRLKKGVDVAIKSSSIGI
ncbi:MobB family relaxase [Aquimarina algiphila]|uniref:MobB family relaxase n=1 Tax=Aquimarina algiphila TaxID=2047982 RepID=UPI00249356A4|nr:MobB family relaxase [Aquimarina algiphila]